MCANWLAEKFDAKADQYFGYLPRRRFAILPAPDAPTRRSAERSYS
jgi:hypothetical protein